MDDPIKMGDWKKEIKQREELYPNPYLQIKLQYLLWNHSTLLMQAVFCSLFCYRVLLSLIAKCTGFSDFCSLEYETVSK
jgi:hypothetical protein